MSDVYLVTGAAGHLGSTIVRELIGRQKKVRALVLPGDENAKQLPIEARLVYGDVTAKSSLKDFFELDPDDQAIVIHAAGIVTIASKYNPIVHEVNVVGTQNVVDCCVREKVKKLVYISSVHAIPELPHGETMTEIDRFDPDKVTGLYAKTKAEATEIVLAAARAGLNASVVHPSGISGPYDSGRGHLTQLLVDYCNGTLTAGVHGGYDFVDVRDVADGVISCCENGRAGECYILSNRYIEIGDLFSMFHKVTGRRLIKTILPLWFAKLTAPIAELYYKLKKQPPLYTSYSLYTLSGNALFSNEKAKRELGFSNRPFEETIADTVAWLEKQNRVKAVSLRGRDLAKAKPRGKKKKLST